MSKNLKFLDEIQEHVERYGLGCDIRYAEYPTKHVITILVTYGSVSAVVVGSVDLSTVAIYGLRDSIVNKLYASLKPVIEQLSAYQIVRRMDTHLLSLIDYYRENILQAAHYQNVYTNAGLPGYFRTLADKGILELVSIGDDDNSWAVIPTALTLPALSAATAEYHNRRRLQKNRPR